MNVNTPGLILMELCHKKEEYCVCVCVICVCDVYDECVMCVYVCNSGQ